MQKFEDLKFKKDKKQFIKDLLAKKDLVGVEANLRGLLRIFQLQTKSEQMAEYTTDWNGVGFTAFDAEFLTSLAKQFIKSKSLSKNQYKHVQKNMKKYSGQLLKIALKKINECDIENLIPNTEVSTWVRGETRNSNYPITPHDEPLNKGN
jgi:hypothetical protein